jgi:hypothetical protein
MKNLLYYIPNRLLNDESIELSSVNRSFLKMFNPWISLSDRTGTLDIPGVPIFNNSPIPEFDAVETFDSCSYRRIDQVVKQFEESSKKNLVILYSGGIDSTLIVCLLVSHPAWNRIKDRTLLAFNEDSQLENPDFFYEMILPNFGHNLISSNHFYEIVTNTDNVCVTGECADNLFGSLTLKSYMDYTRNYKSIHTPWETESLVWLLDKVEDHRDEREQMLYDLVNAAPINIDSNHDFLWWLNYAMKWQAVKYRMSMHSPTAEQAEYMAANVINFFDSEDYQRWALYTKEEKVGGRWNTYKLPAKKLINEIWPNDSYFKFKTKWPSLPTITRYNNAWGFLWQDETGELTATKTYTG